ncbi:MAG TPA: tetratricopeptide repeat protein [Verrucomicrobiae bacterium]|nr:tetratricopeptide repeat protein [Verrucomicrobiae bacterium]
MNDSSSSCAGPRFRPWVSACIGLCTLCLAANLQGNGGSPRLYPDATLPLELPAPLASPTAAHATANGSDAPDSECLPEAIPLPVTQPLTNAAAPAPPSTRQVTNGTPKEVAAQAKLTELQYKLETARYLRNIRQAAQAEPMLIELLGDESPENVQQSALLELAAAAQDSNNPARAQQIYSQFLNKWPNDMRIPEVLLRQGLLFRQMGINNLALTKFYGVMTSALVLKNDQLEYYVRLVQQAQMEIADTHYILGKYTDAAEFFARLLKQTNVANKAAILYKLARCYSASELYAETVASAQDYLQRYPSSPDQPEVRFYLAHALKQLGRNNESLQQVLTLLREQKQATEDRPAVWSYWQQRAGNLIGNHLYSEGEYSKALDVYLSLAELDDTVEWRLPVSYQIAMTYERLWQPAKAAEMYQQILKRESELTGKATPSLKSIFEMSRWRLNFLDWHNRAEDATRSFRQPSNSIPVTASLPSELPSIQ